LAYREFAHEVDQQWDFVLANSDILFEFTEQDPYPTGSAAMMEDVRQNRRLRVYTGGEPHPYLSHETNNRFRAVHDLLGHSAWGHEFGKDGEMSAYAEHRQTFTGLA